MQPEDTIPLQVGLQLVLEILLAQQVKTVAAYSAQDGVHQTSGEPTV